MIRDLEEVVRRAQRGDRAALESLLGAIAPSVYRFGRRMCKNAHDAEDVVQDTLLNVTQHLRTFEGRSSLSSWVFALTRSACSRRRRGLKNAPPVSDDALAEAPDVAASPEAQAAERELTSAVAHALDALLPDHREVLLLRDMEGLTAPETAAVLGISVDAVKSRLHRAREALRAALRPTLAPAPGCPDLLALWAKKLDDELSAADCAAMEQHLATCPACDAACSALKRALFVCQDTSERPVPAAVQERVKAAVRAWSG